MKRYPVSVVASVILLAAIVSGAVGSSASAAQAMQQALLHVGTAISATPVAHTSGAIHTVSVAGSTGGADALKYTSAGATEDEHAVKATAGVLFSITATNTNAAARYLRCSNATAGNTTPGTTTPILDLAIPGNTAGSGFHVPFPNGVTFSTALTCWAVTGAADTDVAEVAANEVKLLYSYK